MNSDAAINASLAQDKFTTEPFHRSLKESTLSLYVNEQQSIMNSLPKIQIFVFQMMSMLMFVYGFLCYDTLSSKEAQAVISMFFASCFTGTLCGANLNPAVSLSNTLKRENKYRPILLAVYIPAQLLGALLGVVFAQFYSGTLLERSVVDGAVSLFQILGTEAIGVFVLVFALLQIANPNTTYINTEVAGYTFIALFYQIGRSFAPAAKLCINPAITIAVALQYATKGDWYPLLWSWVWLLGDLIGAVGATLFYDKLYEPTIAKIRERRRIELQQSQQL